MATFKEDLLDRIQRREQRLKEEPQDEINKAVLYLSQDRNGG